PEAAYKGLYQTVADNSLAWTYGDEFMWIDTVIRAKYGEEAIPWVWQAVINAINEANGWHYGSPKYIQNKSEVIRVIEYHEKRHEVFHQSPRMVKNFRKFLKDMLLKELADGEKLPQVP